MATKNNATRRKLSLLELAQEMSNVSKACRIVGYSRQQFYEIRRNYQTYGAAGVIDRLPKARGPYLNRVSEEVQAAILAHALDHPTHGAISFFNFRSSVLNMARAKSRGSSGIGRCLGFRFLVGFVVMGTPPNLPVSSPRALN